MNAEHLLVGGCERRQVPLILREVRHVVGELDRVLGLTPRGPQGGGHVARGPGELRDHIALLDHLSGGVAADLTPDPDRVPGDGGVGETSGGRKLRRIDVARPVPSLHEGSMSRRQLTQAARSAHVDTFTRDNLPPRDQWPEFLFTLPELDYPPALNCAAELL